jgi:hypothetical protein
MRGRKKSNASVFYVPIIFSSKPHTIFRMVLDKRLLEGLYIGLFGPVCQSSLGLSAKQDAYLHVGNTLFLFV